MSQLVQFGSSGVGFCLDIVATKSGLVGNDTALAIRLIPGSLEVVRVHSVVVRLRAGHRIAALYTCDGGGIVQRIARLRLLLRSLGFRGGFL